MTIGRRRIYILPTRFGVALALLLAAMLVAGLNYNSNLGLAFGFLMASLALVAMHHCHRNLLGLRVDVAAEAEAFAGEHARFEFVLHNDAGIDRCDIEIRCGPADPGTASVANARTTADAGATPDPRILRGGTAPRAGILPGAHTATRAGTTLGRRTLPGDGSAAALTAPVAAPTAGAAPHGVAAHSYRQVAVALPVPQRGLARVARFELRTRHPFGWFRAWTYVHSPLTVFVAPRPGGDRPLPGAAAALGTASQIEHRGEEDFAGLRAYEPGIPLKHMAWKVLARGGEAAVRSYSGLAAQPEWLDWALLDRLDTEAKLSQLCRWVLDSEAAHRSYGLRMPGIRILPSRGERHRSACLRALAAYPSVLPP